MEQARAISGLIAWTVSGKSLLWIIIAIENKKWTYTAVGEGSISSGLWEVCAENGRGLSKCTQFGDELGVDVPKYIEATRAMMLLGMMFMLVAVVCGALKLFIMKDHVRFQKTAGASAILAGVFMLIGVIVYGAKQTELFEGDSLPFNAGFWLAVVAALLAVIAGLLYFVAYNTNPI